MMATSRALARQRAEALQRLTAATNALAAAFDIAPPVIPTHHKDAAHLPTVQMEVIAAFLENVGQVVAEGSAPEPTKPPADELPVELDGSGDEMPPADGTVKNVPAKPARKSRKATA